MFKISLTRCFGYKTLCVKSCANTSISKEKKKKEKKRKKLGEAEHWAEPGPTRCLYIFRIPKPHVYSTMIPGGKLAMMIPELRESDSGDYTCSAIYSNTKKLTKSVHVQTIGNINNNNNNFFTKLKNSISYIWCFHSPTITSFIPLLSVK